MTPPQTSGIYIGGARDNSKEQSDKKRIAQELLDAFAKYKSNNTWDRIKGNIIPYERERLELLASLAASMVLKEREKNKIYARFPSTDGYISIDASTLIERVKHEIASAIFAELEERQKLFGVNKDLRPYHDGKVTFDKEAFEEIKAKHLPKGTNKEGRE